MDEMVELAERCEKATGPDVLLDLDISQTTGAWKRWPTFKEFSPTASLDAAMTLVPEGYMWGAGSWGNPDTDGPWAWCATKQQSRDMDLDYGKAATPALALCAASLRAQATSRGGDTPANLKQGSQDSDQLKVRATFAQESGVSRNNDGGDNG